MERMSLIIYLLLVATLLQGGDLKVGDRAPDFTLPDQDGTYQTLSDYRGHPVVVYFYPKDDTPGCIKEACSIRDVYDGFKQAGIVVFGISYDTPEDHYAFRVKYRLPFTLLSDQDKSVSKAYGSEGVFFPERKTFLIDEKGSILKIYDKVRVVTHGADLLRDFETKD